MLGAGTVHKRLLLLDRLSQSCEKRLVIAQLGGPDATPGALRELLFVLSFVALQLIELGFAIEHAALECRHALRQPALGVIDEVLDRFEAFGALHLLIHPTYSSTNQGLQGC